MDLIHVSLLDVERGHGEAFGAWYRGLHLPRVLARPGWRRAACYECTSGSPDCLTIHELEARAVGDDLNAIPFHEESIGRRIRDYWADTFSVVDVQGAMTDEPALLNIIWTEVESRHAAAFSAWYTDVHVPEIVRCPGWLCARRYRSVTVPNRFLAVYELSDERSPFNSPEYERAVGWDEHVGNLRGYHGFRIYRRRYGVASA
jgi:hypothetical protein